MTSVITQFGVFGVFILMVPESACIPIPSEATLLFAGLAVHHGWMSLSLAIIAATAGNLVGSLLAYWLGASHALDRLPFASRALAHWGAPLRRHGARAVLLARLLPLARTFVALPAGAQGVPLTPFVVFTAIGSAIWAAAFILLGLVFANAWGTLSSVVGRALLVAGLFVVVWTVHRYRPRRQDD
jgi:membrane protein DedA with SNARE-associated domain